MKKTILASLVALSLLAISANAREYKCNDKDVIIAGFKANPSSDGTPIAERLKVYHSYRPWQINNIEERGFTKKTMIGCTANSKGGDVIFYVIHIDKDTGKAYVNSSHMRNQKMFKNSIKHGVSVEIK